MQRTVERSSGWGRPPHGVVLALILAVAAALRLFGFDWDAGTHQHPDERYLTDISSRIQVPAGLSDYFATSRSTLNPYAAGFDRYAYGQLPLTLTRLVAERVGMTTFETVYLPGRALSALADVGTVLVTWLLARRLWGVRHAHLAALLLALAVLPIQLAHFFAVDTFAAFFSAATLLFAHRAWQGATLRDAALAGAMAGLGMACKISAAILLPVLLIGFLVPFRGRITRAALLDGLTLFGVALVGAFVAFRLAEPYAFLGPQPWNLRLNVQWIQDKAYWAEVSSGGVDVPYMIQWAGTTPYAFVLQGIVQWGMGPALGLASLAGLGLASWRLPRSGPSNRAPLLLVLWAGVNLLYFGGQFAKFLRYLLPAYFALVLLAAYALLEVEGWWRRRSPARFAFPRLIRPGVAARVPLLLVVLATAGWALAFSAIYTQPHSRIQASQWLYANIPAGATLAVEHWDDRLPIPLPGSDASAFQYQELTLYDNETPAKRERLLSSLERSDYIVLASRRLVDSIPRLPERYPLATEYYRLLFSGELGFERVAEFKVTPSLGPLRIDDSRAQEDFTVYDHPSVEIWAKRPDFSLARVTDLLSRVPVENAVPVRPVDAGKGALLLSPDERAAAQAGGTWSALFDRDGWATRLALPLWLVAAEVLALLSFPVVWRVLPFLPDRGWGVSKILGLALTAYVAWLLASLRAVPFGRGSLLLAALLLGAASLLAVRHQARAFRAWLRGEWRLLLVVQAVFLAAFALFVLIRAANPDLWHPTRGGEKPMDFAYLNAVVKSDYFPPYDPWFAGGIMNYYYFGWVLVAALVKLTGIVPAVAYNLALPTFFGALCAGAFSLAFALSLPPRRVRSRAHAYVAGVAGVLAVGLLGNLDGGAQVLERLWQLGGQAAPAFGGAARFAAGAGAVLRGSDFPPLDYWRSTRLIGPEDVPPITEFPYFSFLYGDLHPHLMALPLTVAALLVSLNLVWALRRGRVVLGRSPWRALPFIGSLVLGAFIVGMLRAANTWDFPTYLAILVGALALGSIPGLRTRQTAEWVGLASSVAAVVALSQVLFWPYIQRYQLFYTGIEPLRVNTPVSQYVTIFGLFFFLCGSLVLSEGTRAVRRLRVPSRQGALVAEPRLYGMLVPLPPLLFRGLGLPALPAFAGSILAGGFWLGGRPTRGVIILGIGLAAAVGLARWRQPQRAAQAAFVVAALGVTLIPEYVALAGDIGRMNTVFKFYLQAWVLLAVAAAVALGWLVRRSARQRWPRPVRAPWAAALGLLVLGAASYPLLASQGKIGQRFVDLPWTIDGMAYMDRAQYQERGRDLNLPGDAAALRWLQDTVQGSPVVLEGRGGIYTWSSRVSIYTGLPTVLGWDWHQTQQRAGYTSMIQQRVSDVQRAYDSPSAADLLAVVRTYGVRWVYVGGLERATYSAAGIEKIARMPELRLAYDRDGVQIYEVLT